MNNVTVIWIDSTHAKVMDISPERMERRTIQAHSHEHHTHRQDNIDKERNEHGMFKEIAKTIPRDSQVLLLGPGIAKHHFQTYLVEQYPIVAKKIVGCRNVDHPSDAEIAAMAKEFFIMPLKKEA